MGRIVTVTPNPLFCFLAEAEVALGSTSYTGSFIPLAGGKGLCAGRLLARLGHEVIACGFLGGPFTNWMHDLVSTDGMRPAFTPTAHSIRVGFVTVAISTGATSVFAEGFPVTSAEVEIFIETIDRFIPDADLLLVGGSVPDPVTCGGLLVSILELAAQHGCPCWVDSYGSPMQLALACSHPPALCKPNASEVETAADWKLSKELHITHGAMPVKVFHPDGAFEILPPTVKERNAIGSGDCYLAALAHARLTGETLERQLRFAVAAGAANAASSGIADIQLRDIIDLLPHVSVRTVQE